jgi:hypothetical protein
VIRLMLRHGLTPAFAGAGVGLLGSLGLTGFLRSLLFGVEPNDTVTLAFAVVFLCAWRWCMPRTGDGAARVDRPLRCVRTKAEPPDSLVADIQGDKRNERLRQSAHGSARGGGKPLVADRVGRQRRRASSECAWIPARGGGGKPGSPRSNQLASRRRLRRTGACRARRLNSAATVRGISRHAQATA